MIALDTNILVYAHHAGSPKYDAALKFLRNLVEGDQPWAIPLFVLVEFVGVVTHRRFDPPISVAAAFDRIEAIRESPSLHVLTPGARFLSIVSRLSIEAEASGNLAYDAAIAALCLEHGVSQIVTEDRDFRRFGQQLRIVTL